MTAMITPSPGIHAEGVRKAQILMGCDTLVQCCMLDGTNKNDGFWVRARRKPQRYPQVSRGCATQPWRKRRVFMFQIACNIALEPTLSFFLQDLGFRVDAIYPADNPSTAMISGHGLSIRLVRGASQGVSTIYLLCDDPTKVADGATVLRAPNGVTVKLAMADPPMIRHRVLESSAQAEVIEIGTPAEHITMADYTMTLPDAVLEPQRDFNGQRFS